MAVLMLASVLLSALLGCHGDDGPGPDGSVDDSDTDPDDTGVPPDDSEPPPDDSTDDSGDDTGTEPPTQDLDVDGWTVDEGDCDDTDAAIYPGAPEVDGDLVDDDCNGTAVTGVGSVSLATSSVFVGNEVDLYAGAALAFLPDVTGDGLPDVAIGAPVRQAVDSADPLTGNGRAYILSGLRSGVSTPLDARAEIRSDDRYDATGATVAGIGDLDADGLDDFAVARPGGALTSESGEVSVFLAPLAGGYEMDDADWRVEGEHDTWRLGTVVVSMGDSEFALTMPVGAGSVYLFRGLPTERGVLQDAVAVLVGDTEPDTRTGASLDAGDFDGDGSTDLAIAAPYLGADAEGGVTLSPGPWSGDLVATYVGLTWNGTMANEYAGDSVRAIGDVDGDGLDDVLIGAPGRCETGFLAGGAYVVLGAADLSGTASLEDAALRIEGENDYDALGDDTLALGDIDGDGDPDLGIAATRLYDRNSFPPPRIYVALSPLTSGVISAGELDAAWIGTPGAIGAGVPYAITHAFAAGGDLDSDGIPEILVGAPQATVDGVEGAGAAYLIEGLPF